MEHETLRISFDQFKLAVRYLCFLQRWTQWSYWHNARPDHQQYQSPEPAEFPRTSIDVFKGQLGQDTYGHVLTWLRDDHAQRTLDTLTLFFQGAPNVEKETTLDIGELMHWWQRVAHQQHYYANGHSVCWAIRTVFEAFAASEITEQTLQAPIEATVCAS